MGACSSTTLQDADYWENNFEYSLYGGSMGGLKNNARLIYASSAATYGDGELGYSDEESLIPRLKPLNLYGESKQKIWSMGIKQDLPPSWRGWSFLMYFGPNEYHKEIWKALWAKAYQRVTS